MSEPLICQYEGCDEELTYGGRGRPPKYCEEHKSVAKAEKAAAAADAPAPAARPRPGAKADAPAPAARPRPGAAAANPSPATPRSRPRPGAAQPNSGGESDTSAVEKAQTPSPAIGKADVKSRAKAEANANRNAELVAETGTMADIPYGIGGRPMAKIRMTASELVPTGQYANVSVGPALIECYVDLDKDVNGDGYFTDAEKNVMVTALNELAEVVERDVVAVQRSLVMESLQEQLAS